MKFPTEFTSLLFRRLLKKNELEFLLSGAKFIQLGTINYKFPNLIASLENELEEYLNKSSIDSIKKLIGKIIIEDK